MKRIFLLAALAIATTGFAQKVSNKLVFPKGQKLQMVITVNSTTSSPAAGESKVDATITRLFDIQDANAGGATIEHKIKRIQFNVESMMASQSFDSEKPADMNGPAGKSVAKSLKNKYTMNVDATGKVTNAKKDDSNPNTQENDPAADLLAGALSQAMAGVEMPQPGDATDFSILPSYEVGKGDSWTDSTAKRKTVYTISDITDREIIITYSTDEDVHNSMAVMGTEINMASHDKTTGRIVLDRQTGLLKEKTGDTDSNGTIDLMGQSAPMTKKIKKKIIVS